MSSRRPPRHQDLLRLSLLAGRRDVSGREGNAEGDLGIVLLRVQADLFAAATSRDAATVRAFESLALALLPKADAQTLAHVAERVRHLPETPRSIRALLPGKATESRPDHGTPDHDAEDPRTRQIDEAILRDDPATDLALAHDPGMAASPHGWAVLTRRARRRRDLAEALLARPDLPCAHAAALYLVAAPGQRAHIRDQLAGMAGHRHGSHQLIRPTQDATARLLAAARAQDEPGFGAMLASMLGLRPAPLWRFAAPERYDFLALALLAAGIGEDAAIRIFLTLDGDVAKDVASVFHLAGLFRRTPRSVACRLIEASYDVAIAIPARRPREMRQAVQQSPPASPGFGTRSMQSQRYADLRPAETPRRAGDQTIAPRHQAGRGNLSG